MTDGVLYSLTITNKRNKDAKIRIGFSNFDEVYNFIKNISTRDLIEKRYEFKKLAYLEHLFSITYNKDFYEVKDGLITLKKMPNGVHREKASKSRRNFNNRILKRTLESVKSDLEKRHELMPMEMKFDDSRYHYFKFHKSSKDFVSVQFDKMKWDFVVTYVNTTSVDFLHDVIDTLKKYTIHTRNHRKKMKKYDDYNAK